MATPPQADEDWFAKEIELSELFSHSEPVRETDLFSGRTSQLRRLIEAVFQGGQHAVIYGERGVGKTSLANTFRQKIFPVSSRVKFFTTQCLWGNDYADIWTRAFGPHRWPDGDYAFDEIDDTIDPHSLLRVMGKFGENTNPVFIFDEFDRVSDEDTKLRMAETIKLFSDECPRVTIVIVGIGHTIRDLLEDHMSVRRALRQIEMPRMSPEEIREIVTVRLGKAAMTIGQGTLDEIVTLCRGMPGYAHLLGLHSAKAAVAEHTLHVTDEHLWKSLSICLEEAGESTRQDYAKAVQSPQPGNHLRQALLACALAMPDDFGSFTAASVRDPFTAIIGSRRDIPDFNRHLKAFCSDQRGPILERSGSHKNYRYKFRDAMMQCYVIMKGVSDGMIRPDGAS